MCNEDSRFTQTGVSRSMVYAKSKNGTRSETSVLQDALLADEQ
jgi:hypothetical protein